MKSKHLFIVTKKKEKRLCLEIRTCSYSDGKIEEEFFAGGQATHEFSYDENESAVKKQKKSMAFLSCIQKEDFPGAEVLSFVRGSLFRQFLGEDLFCDRNRKSRFILYPLLLLAYWDVRRSDPSLSARDVLLDMPGKIEALSNINFFEQKQLFNGLRKDLGAPEEKTFSRIRDIIKEEIVKGLQELTEKIINENRELKKRVRRDDELILDRMKQEERRAMRIQALRNILFQEPSFS